MNRTLVLFALISLFYLSKLSAQIIPNNRVFYIQSYNNYGTNNLGFWDIPGKAPTFEKSQNLQVWELSDKLPDRKFQTVYAGKENGYDWYYIVPLHAKNKGRLAINSGKTANGTNVLIFSNTNAPTQKFRFVHTSNGQFKIYTWHGQIIVMQGTSSKNGTNVCINEDYNHYGTQWVLLDANTNKKFIPNELSPTQNIKPELSESGSGAVGATFYTIPSGENLVYGDIGLDNSGRYKYSFVATKKYNDNKPSYKADTWVGVLKPIEGALDDYKWDRFIIYNGNKFGPYDFTLLIGKGSVQVGDPEFFLQKNKSTLVFAGRKADKYELVLNNKTCGTYTSTEWGPEWAITNDLKKASHSLRLRKDAEYLFFNCKMNTTAHKGISFLQYSDNNEDILYVVQDENDQFYVMFNHEKVTQGYSNIRGCGFIPNSNKYYYVATDANKEELLVIDGKKMPLPANAFFIQVDANSRTLIAQITVLNTVDNSKAFHFIDYNIESQQIKSFGPYSKVFRNRSEFTEQNRFLAGAIDETGVPFVFTSGGEVLGKYSEFKDTPYLLIYTTPEGQELVLSKNPKTQKEYFFTPQGERITPSFTTIRTAYGEHVGGAVFKGYTKEGSTYNYYIKAGEKEFNLKLNSTYVDAFYNQEANKIYAIHKDNNTDTCYLYIDGVKVEKSWTNIDPTTFRWAPDGSYAFLYQTEKKGLNYWNLNTNREYIWKLYANGKNYEGIYGQPEYSKLDDGFIVIKQEGNKLLGVKL